MITMTLEAEDMPQMRDELLKAAHAIKTSTAVEDEDTNEMYEGDSSFRPPAAPAPDFSQDTEEQEDQVPVQEPGVTGTVSTGDGELDANGFPWDSRIHAESKTKTKAGLWKYRRNLEDAVKAQVEAQLKGQQSLPPMGTPPRTFQAPTDNVVQFTPPPVPAAGPAPVFPVTPQSQPAPVAPVQAAPVVEQSPTQTAPTSPVPAQTPAHSLETFKANLFPVIAQLTKTGKITPGYVQQIKTHFNVAELWDLNDAQQAELFNVLSTTNPPIIIAVQS